LKSTDAFCSVTHTPNISGMPTASQAKAVTSGLLATLLLLPPTRVPLVAEIYLGGATPPSSGEPSARPERPGRTGHSHSHAVDG